VTSRSSFSARAFTTGVVAGALTLALTVVMAAASSGAGATTVQVQPGQNLSEIASLYGTSVSALAAANGISNPNQILIGSTLNVPDAAAPTTASSGSGGGSGTVTVVIGDTLSAIAADYGVSVADLAAANGISDPNQILAGSTLVVPGAGAPAAAPSPPSAPPPTVTVMLGDTLTAIAAQYGVSVPTLASANGISDPNQILVGATLVVPSAAASAPPAPSSAPPSVTVTSGETLSAIAADYGVSVAALAAANGISDPNQILIGATLVVPGAGSTSALPPQLLADQDLLSLRPLFVYWANQFGISAALLEAMCWWESGWQSQVVSPTGAIGIGQLEPATVAAMQAQLNDPGLNPSVPSDNVEMSAAFLYDLLTETGSTPVALARYYQGAASISRVGELPATVQYVTGITNYVPDFS
jgi:N-acetylmuramoyl-L-alanine amidase